LRAQATCPPLHAGAKSETIKAEQIGIDISLVGFAVSLGRISLGRISLDAATQSLGEPAFESRTSRNQGLLAIKDFSQSFCPRGPPGWGRQPEVKWPAAPSLPTTSNCPASNRAMASTDSNGEIASGSAAEPEVGRLYCKRTPQK
jgi:hypothetical protein